MLHLGDLKYSVIPASRCPLQNPNNIVMEAQPFDDRTGNVLIGENAHWVSRPEGVDLLVTQACTGIGETGSNIFTCDIRVVVEDLAFRPSLGKQFQNKLDSQTCSPDYGLPDKNLLVYLDP